MKKRLMSSALTIAALTPPSVGLPHQGKVPTKAGVQSQACKKSRQDKIRRMVEEKVKQIIVDELGVSRAQVRPTARLIDDLGADSLDMVELVMRLEEAYGIELPDQDAEKLQRVCDIYDYIEKRMRQGKQRARLVHD